MDDSPSGTPAAPPALLRGVGRWVAGYRAVSRMGFPARYPLVQFPNPPLMIALVASVAGWFVDGAVQDYVTAVGTMGIVVWAYLELAEGVNLFRRGLGAVMLVSQAIAIAHTVTS